ncbi:MYND-type zinc finger protein mub1 [Asimina triloba]
MSGEQLEIKFRLFDGSDIGPKKFPLATSIASVKETILSQWPKVNDVKLINAGKILENNRTLRQCKSPLFDLAGGVVTMHVVVRPPSEKRIAHGLDGGSTNEKWVSCQASE